MLHQFKNKHVANRTGVRIGVAALALSAILLPACTTGQPTATSSPEVGENISPQDVRENTEDLVGQMVTVRSELEQTVGPNAFEIQDERLFGDESILVVNATGAPLPDATEEGMEFQVTGEVRQFVATELQREYGLDLQPELYAEYETRPAIVAESIALAPDASEVAENPEAFYGQTIAIESEIDEVIDPTAFTLSEGFLNGENLLVLSAAPEEAGVADGRNVVVTGQLRPFVVADIERDYDLTWDSGLQQQLTTEYENRPVFVAEAVFPFTE